DGARIGPIERQDIARAARGIIQVDMRQPFPPSPDTDHLTTNFTASIDHALDHRVQAGNIPTAGEDTHTLDRHQYSSLSWIILYYRFGGRCMIRSCCCGATGSADASKKVR